jgi:AcrR family transcriptional regulator
MASGSPRPTPDALLDAAEELFARHGYASVGIREIAERARANIASIKYHFGSKSELYLATVRRAMSRGDAAAGWDVLTDFEQRGSRDPDRAAIAFVRFVRLLLDRMLSAAEPEPRCFALMLREAAEPSEAIDVVVQDFIEPHQRTLMNVLSAVSGDRQTSTGELAASATSVMSQILHYRIFRPFLARMPQTAPLAGDLDGLAGHIAKFSLRGIGFDESRAAAAIKAGLAADVLPRQPALACSP